jgi:hypothetical protein
MATQADVKTRCAKHEPQIIEGSWGRRVLCAKCGREGFVSRGQRKFGRPPRIVWFRPDFRPLEVRA